MDATQFSQAFEEFQKRLPEGSCLAIIIREPAEDEAKFMFASNHSDRCTFTLLEMARESLVTDINTKIRDINQN